MRVFVPSRPRPALDIASLASRIAQFSANLRAAGPKTLSEEEASYFEAFRDLHAQAAQVDRAELACALPKEDRGLFDVLFLGYETRAQRGDPTGFSSLVRLVRQYPEFQRAVALAEYLKTPEGHAFADLSTKMDPTTFKRCLPDFLAGGMGEFLNSVRAEHIGRFIGYVSANRMERDIAKFAEDEVEGQSIDTWLMDQMLANDKEFVIIQGRTEGFGRPDLNRNEGYLAGGTASSTSARASHRPDHFFMEFDATSNSEAAVAVHYGSSTSKRDHVAVSQGMSAISNLTALLNVVHDHNSGPLHKAKVKPYYYLTGLFSVDEPVGKGKVFSATLQKAGLEWSQRTAIAQMSFLSMIACTATNRPGTYSPHPDRTLALLSHNPFISGCDTLDLHGLALQIQDEIHLGLRPERRELVERRTLNLLADKMVLAADGLSQALPDLFKSIQRSGNSGESAAALDALLTTAQVFSQAVPFRSQADLDQLSRVRSSVQKLFDQAMANGLDEYEVRFSSALLTLSSPKAAPAKNALASALSHDDEGMPKIQSRPAIPPSVQLRECLRQLADGLISALPKSKKAQEVANILRAGQSAKEFSGLFDHRVRWRPWTESLAKDLKRKGAPARVCAAFDVLREHGFRGRVRNQTDREFKASLEEGRQALLSGLTKHGLGYSAKQKPVKSRGQ